MEDLDIGATIKGFAPGQKVFNRYTLTKMLGRGGMGVVWLARDVELGRDTALKFLPEVVATDRAAIEDMKREVRRAIDLAHPHIVKIHDFITDGRTAAVSMEYIAGGTLSSLRIDQPGQVFAVADLERWVGQLCGALDYAHRDAEVVHRDLKPANLMVDGRGRLRVLDFGIAASISESVSRVSKQAGSSGTPVYMSPQQMMGEEPAVTDDIYSVGATLFELLTGKPPFHAGNIMLQVQNKAAPLLNERRKVLNLEPVPAAWEQTIAACLAKDPAERPQSGADLLKRLGGEAAPPVVKTVPVAQPSAAAQPAAPNPASIDLPGAGTSWVRRLMLAPLLATIPVIAPLAALAWGINYGGDEAAVMLSFILGVPVLAVILLVLLVIRRPWRARGSYGIVAFGAIVIGLIGVIVGTRLFEEGLLIEPVAAAVLAAGCGGISGWWLYRIAARASFFPSGPIRGLRPAIVYTGQALLVAAAMLVFGGTLPAAHRRIDKIQLEREEAAARANWEPKIIAAYSMVFDRRPDAATVDQYLKRAMRNTWWQDSNLRNEMRESEEGRQGGRLLVPQEFAKIQDAINAAKPGNVIMVAPGTYTEGLYISKSINLRGAGRGQVTVSSNADTNVLNISEGASGVKVDGFTFRHTGRTEEKSRYTTVWLSGKDVEFTNNTVLNSNGYGIYLRGAQNFTVQSNIINGSGWDGIAVYRESSGRIARNEIRDNRQCGIQVLEQPGTLLIAENTITGNGDGGLLISKGDGVEISDNNLYGNGNTSANGGIGISSGAGRPVLRGNRTYDNKGTGIWWEDEHQPPYIHFGNMVDGRELPVGSVTPLR